MCFVLLRAVIPGKQRGAPAREYFRGSLIAATARNSGDIALRTRASRMGTRAAPR